MSALKFARRVVPDSAKRAHQRHLERRRAETTRARNVAYTTARGFAVEDGPMKGLRYPSDLAIGIADLVPKLVGAYELEIHDALREWIASDSAQLIDIGSAEGYYAVGLAVAKPSAHITAFELEDQTREALRAVAVLNGVEERIDFRGAATLAELQALDPRGGLVICDCEGAELELLDPVAVPWLRQVPIIVELHDFIDDRVTQTLLERFSASHDIALIDEVRRDGTGWELLSVLDPRDRADALNEHRPVRMQWAFMQPH